MRISDWSSDMCSSDLFHSPQKSEKSASNRLSLATIGQARQAASPSARFASLFVPETTGERAFRAQAADASRQDRFLRIPTFQAPETLATYCSPAWRTAHPPAQQTSWRRPFANAARYETSH